MIIIGSGIAGAMANGYFSSFNPVVYDAKEKQENTHKAIMHFKDFSIGYLLGIPLQKVKIVKGIYYKGAFTEPNPEVMNLYSRKVSGGIFDRSIRTIEPVERFISKIDYSIPNVRYGKMLTKIEPGKCYFQDGSEAEYDTCISTIPMPIMAKAAGIELDPNITKSFPIFVCRYPIEIKCNVFQTIYFPDPKINAYRASLEEQTLIVETFSPQPVIEKEVLNAFGLSVEDIGKPQIHVQQMGKIISMDDMTRRQIIVDLTEKFNIYSLGRYAVWKSITSDVLLRDLDSIDKMIKLSGVERKYNSKLEKIK